MSWRSNRDHAPRHLNRPGTGLRLPITPHPATCGAAPTLLAFLSAHAMHGVTKAGAKLVQPAVGDDSLYRWVAGDRTGERPRFGTLPNHFVAEVNGDARGVAEAAVGIAHRRVDPSAGCRMESLRRARVPGGE